MLDLKKNHQHSAWPVVLSKCSENQTRIERVFEGLSSPSLCLGTSVCPQHSG